MNINSRKSSIRTIKSTHPAFRITDGIVITPRAGFEISSSCPQEYRMVLRECIDRGWIQPVAHMKEQELVIAGLSL